MKKDPSHKDSGFTLPDDYFSNLEERIRERMELSEAEQQLPEKEGFTVPEGYFETLGSRILENSRPEAPESKVIAINRKLWKYAVAAVITALVAGSTWMIQENNQTITFDDLSLTDIEWLLDQGSLEIPQQYLINEANDSILFELTMADTMLDKDVLETYLAEESDLYELID